MGCTVVGTSRTAEKLEQCRALGLDHAVVAPREPRPGRARRRDHRRRWAPVDVTIDLVGGDVPRDRRAGRGARLGRIVVVASQAGGRAELEIGALMGKRLRIHGTVLRARSRRREDRRDRRVRRATSLPLLADGTVAPSSRGRSRSTSAAEAYDLLAADAVFGKIVLDLIRP